MNIDESRVFAKLCEANYSQRELSSLLNFSLGKVNNVINSLSLEGYIENKKITIKGENYLKNSKVKSAIILAAGYGVRMVPINTEIPKALLKVRNEILIERIIEQLQECGIDKIYIVVGFLKEKFEYLIDKYNVELIYNGKYRDSNNCISLSCAKRYLGNSYIIPGDLYFTKNPFLSHMFCSYYLLSDRISKSGYFSVGNSNILVCKNKNNIYHVPVGVAYIHKKDTEAFIKKLNYCCEKNSNSFWEDAIFIGKNDFIYSKIISSNEYYEINSFDDLKKVDEHSDCFDVYSLNVIKKALKCEIADINNVSVLKKGMTNKSFLFSYKNKKYIMRIPGEGTGNLINRKEEADVYKKINSFHLCDDVIYINPENGYKITEYLNNAHNCDSSDFSQVKKCMKRLRAFHDLKLKVNHQFDIYEKIEYYESLWNGNPSIFNDYGETKKKVYELKNIIDQYKKEYSLTHIDAVCDNFLFVNIEGKEDIKIIDWEYAAMQDTDVDIAMNCIYAMYDRKCIDKTIDAYYIEGCPKTTRIKIYCYIAICGLLWSNWCEYKRQLGVDFGEYSLRQYRYAKEFYKIIMEEIANV